MIDAADYVLRAHCLDSEALPSLPDKSVDVLIQDPPYDLRTHTKGRRGHRADYKEPTRPGAIRAQFNRARALGFKAMTPELMAGVADECARLTRRWVLTFCSLEMIADWRAALELAGFEYVRTCIWHKRGTTPQFTGDRPAQAAEAIVCAHPPGRKSWNGRGTHGWFDFDFEPEDGADVVFDDPIVLNRGKVRQRFHTTQKPLGLMRKLVTLFSDAGELVVDPFCGSGTTLVAALELGRQTLGIDNDEAPGSVNVARWRVAKALGLPVSEEPPLLLAAGLGVVGVNVNI